MRTTKDPRQALQRLADAAGAKVTKKEGKFQLRYRGETFIPKKAVACLAALAFVLSFNEDWPALREATQYDPGVLRHKDRLMVNVPSHGVTGWEQGALLRLAVTEVS